MHHRPPDRLTHDPTVHLPVHLPGHLTLQSRPRSPLHPPPARPGQVKSGAIAFLKTEYSYLCVFVLALAGTLYGLFALTDTTTVALSISLSFVFGASLSAGAGWWGMPAGSLL